MGGTILAERMSERLRACPAGPLRGDIAVPGDKSISHRALILAAMAEGESRIEGLLESEDVARTLAAVRSLGARAERVADAWAIRGGRWRSPGAPIDCGNSGTAARLLIGAAAGRAIEATFTGDESLRGRPMDRVLRPLAAMGAGIEGGPLLPVTVRGGGLRGTQFVNRPASAQVKSAVLLAGLGADGPVELIEPAPSRDHTERLLAAFGCEISVEPGESHRIRLGERRTLRAARVSVPGDPSSAAFPLVAALIVPGSQVTVRGVGVNALRTGLFETLREMGADLDYSNRRDVGGEPVADLSARHSQLRGVEVPADRAPAMIDEYPLLAVAAAFAHGPTRMRSLAELRIKETDRLEAIRAGLAACGAAAREEGDDLVVEGLSGAVPGGGAVATDGDHRIAMAFLVLGLGAQASVTVDRPEMIATSFPAFAALMRGLGGGIDAAR